ncbi:NAD-dependent epimerase/dehydratase family protein [Skermanella aerolata]|uniref:NAD-dependent epimerase/dehydratase family protein n=1 Tax=Skermanella aerolata TaxID=393310 RepID=UPI003D1EA202
MVDNVIDVKDTSGHRRVEHPQPARNPGNSASPASVPGVLAITGANGYIGREVVRIARNRGFEVRALVRRPGDTGDAGVRSFSYALGDEPPDTALAGVTAVIHLAMDMSGGDTPGSGGEDRNVTGTLRLRDAALRQGIRRFLFVSSQSAAPGALSSYGRAKWQVERALGGAEDIAVRPGMVYGGPERGLFGVLCRLATRLPVIPVIRGSAPLYPIHVEDLALALVDLASSGMSAERVLCLGSAEPITLKEFLALLAEARLGRKPWLIPVPIAPLSALLAALCLISPKAAFLRERVLGIQALPSMDTAAGLRTSAITLRPLDLRRRGGPPNRRALLREGVALQHYVFGGRASLFAARRWLRLLPADAESLKLPEALTTRPRFLRLIEPLPLLPRGDRAREFAKRLHLALLVGEISGPSSAVLTTACPAGWPVALLDMAVAGWWDAASMVPRLLVHLKWWRR